MKTQMARFHDYLTGNGPLPVSSVDSRRALDTGNVRNLIRVDEATAGQLVLAPILAERLQAHGLRLVGVREQLTLDLIPMQLAQPGDGPAG